MSWTSRFPSWASSRLSPFSSRGDTSTISQAPQISDADFSYITTDDLAAHKSSKAPTTPTREPDSPHDTDCLILRHKKISYNVHFPAYSIDRGELQVVDLRRAAAKKLQADESRIKLFWKGKCLKDDKRLARDEGLRSDRESEILVVAGGDRIEMPSSLGESPESSTESETVDGHEEDDTGSGRGDEGKRRRRVRHKNKKKGKKSAAPVAPEKQSSQDSANGNPGYGSASQSTSNLASQPQTPMAKLQAIASHFHTKLVPECIPFLGNPPSDKGKREYEHKRLTETIMMQVMLKLDAVETEGDPDARAKRKELVKEVQAMFNKLDETMK